MQMIESDLSRDKKKTKKWDCQRINVNNLIEKANINWILILENPSSTIASDYMRHLQKKNNVANIENNRKNI